MRRLLFVIIVTHLVSFAFSTNYKRDSLYKLVNENSYSKHQVEHIDKGNEILQQRNTIQELESESQKSQVVMLSIIGIFVLGLVVYTWHVAKVRKKLNQVLTDKNKIIHQKNNDLTKLNATKDKFLSIVAHDLKNPFNAVLGFADLLMERYDELDDDMRQEYIEIVHKSATLYCWRPY